MLPSSSIAPPDHPFLPQAARRPPLGPAALRRDVARVARPAQQRARVRHRGREGPHREPEDEPGTAQAGRWGHASTRERGTTFLSIPDPRPVRRSVPLTIPGPLDCLFEFDFPISFGDFGLTRHFYELQRPDLPSEQTEEHARRRYIGDALFLNNASRMNDGRSKRKKKSQAVIFFLEIAAIV